MHSRARVYTRVSLTAIACILFTLTGCVSETPVPRPKPSIGPPPRQPRPGTMWMGVNPPSDSNANGYPDSMVVTVYLFADSGYVRSLQFPGTFHFKLIAKGGKVLREWSVASPGPKVTAIKTGVGEGSLVALSLLDDSGTDVFAYQSAEVVGSFETAKGEVRVQAPGNALLIGRVPATSP